MLLQLKVQLNATQTTPIAVLGKPGIGKTHIVRCTLKEMGYEPVWISSESCSHVREVIDLIQKASSTNLMNEIAQTHLARAVVVDDIDVWCQFDRCFLNTLADFLSKNSIRIPVILIGPGAFEKKLNNMRIVRMQQKCEGDMFIILRHLAAATSINATDIMGAIEKCDGNITYALALLGHGSGASEQGHTASASGTGATKDARGDIADVFRMNADQMRSLVQQDPWLHPLRFHENLLTELDKRKGLKVQKQSGYLQIMRYMCDWDYMMSSCAPETSVENVIAAIHTLQKFPYKKCEKDVIDKVCFTKIFSQLSLQKKRERQNFKDSFPWKDVGF